MALRAAIIVGLAASVAMASAQACISSADPAEAAREMNEWITRDRAAQASLVPRLVEEADTIVVARALQGFEDTLDTSFLLLRVIKGRAEVGSTLTYRAS